MSNLMRLASFYAFLVFLFTTSVGFTAPSCKSLFVNTWEGLFALHTKGAGEYPLDFDFTIYDPMTLKKISEGVYERVPSHKRSYQYHADWSYSSGPKLVAVNTLVGRSQYSPTELMQKIYASYDKKIQPEIIETISKVEKILIDEAPSRHEYGMVSGTDNAGALKIYGTLRFYNGTAKKYSQQRPELPFEMAMQIRYGNTFMSQLKSVQRLQRLRADSPYQEIYEIGKFSIDGPMQIHANIRSVLELFMLRTYFQKAPNALFFVHVASKAHLRLYQSRYGFRILEEIQVPGSKDVEYILEASADELAVRLRSHYALPAPEYQIIDNYFSVE